MNDKREFKIDLNAPEAEEDFRPRRSGQNTRKTASASPSVAVLFAFMALGIGLVWMYHHFTARLANIDSEGTEGIANLSSEFNAKLISMSKDLSDQKTAVQTTLSGLETQISKLKKSISAIESAKADQKEMDAAVSGVKKSLAPFQSSLAKMDEELKGIGQKADNAAAQVKKIESEVAVHGRVIGELKDDRVDKQYVESQLQKERDSQQKKIAGTSDSLLKQIAVLEKKIADMKKRLAAVETRMTQLTKKTAAPAPASSRRTYTPPPATSAAPAKPGEILEQDIN